MASGAGSLPEADDEVLDDGAGSAVVVDVPADGGSPAPGRFAGAAAVGDSPESDGGEVGSGGLVVAVEDGAGAGSLVTGGTGLVDDGAGAGSLDDGAGLVDDGAGAGSLDDGAGLVDDGAGAVGVVTGVTVGDGVEVGGLTQLFA